MKKELTIIFEKGENTLFGRIEHHDFLIVENAENHEKVVFSLKEILQDYLGNEGKETECWRNTSIEEISFKFRYDLTDFFHTFNQLNVSRIADKAGINPSLMRQYSTGLAFPSEKQLKKIETTINNLGAELQGIQLTAKQNS